MIIKSLNVGPVMANCYIVGCEKTKTAIVIDPGGEANRILMTLAEDNMTLKYILNTHGHFDHVGANKEMKDATGADILIHQSDAPMLTHVSAMAMAMGMSVENSPEADRMIEDGDQISFGEITLKVIHTPGHSPGGVSFYANKSVFVGDTLFAGSVGRTDFPGGDFDLLKNSIQQKLFTLDNDVTVYPGHMGKTTIETEKKFNPFVGLQ